MSSKAKILTKGSILRVTEFFATALVTLAMTPFIINSLGDAMYGLWIFVGSFLGYYGLMDFGLNSAIQRFLSRAIGAKDKEKANKVINTSLWLFTMLGFITLIFSFIIAFVFPLFIKNITNISLFRVIILILGLNFAIGFPLRVFSGILTANIRYDLSTGLELIKLVLRTILIIVFLKAGHGILALAFITFFADISGYVVKYFIVRRLYKYIILSRTLIDKSLIRPLFGYSVYTFISQIADQLRFNIDYLVITIFLGFNFVTLYSIAARLTKYFIEFVWSATGFMLPVFSQYESRNDYASIREKFIFTTKITSYLTIFVGGTLIIFGRAFIERWVGKEYLSAYPILVVLGVAIISDLMLVQTVSVLYGISKHKYLTISNSIEGIANLILSVVLVKKYGLIGVALGTAIPMLVIKVFVQPMYVCKFIGQDIYKFYFEIIFPVILKSALVLYIFYQIFGNVIKPNYGNIVSLISLNFTLFAIVIFFVGLKRNEQIHFRKLIFR